MNSCSTILGFKRPKNLQFYLQYTCATFQAGCFCFLCRCLLTKKLELNPQPPLVKSHFGLYLSGKILRHKKGNRLVEPSKQAVLAFFAVACSTKNCVARFEPTIKWLSSSPFLDNLLPILNSFFTNLKL